MSSAENVQSATAVLARTGAGCRFSIGRKPVSEKTRSVFERALRKAENMQSAAAVLARANVGCRFSIGRILQITEYGGTEHER